MPTKKKSTKSTKVAKTTNVVAPAPAVEAVKEVAAPTLSEQFDSLLGELSALRSKLTSVTSQVRALSKRSEREVKIATKAGRKKRKSGNRAPSGFVKQQRLVENSLSFSESQKELKWLELK